MATPLIQTIEEAARQLNLLKDGISFALKQYPFLTPEDLLAVVNKGQDISQPDFEAALVQLQEEGQIVYGKTYDDCWEIAH